MQKIVRVNTNTGQASYENATEEQLKCGGRHFIAQSLVSEVPPTCEALGKYNKLIISSGLFADTPLSTSGKLSFGGKSPLTGGIKESNVGGLAGKRLAKLGIKALILEDIPNQRETRILHIMNGEARLMDAPYLQSMLVDDTFNELRSRFGSKAGFLCIGPAGEMLMHAAGIASVDMNGVQVRYAARGGLGAVMGAKGIKAIVIDASNGVKPSYHDPDLYRHTVKVINQELVSDPKSKNRKIYGTLDILDMANQIGVLPTRNFRTGQFEKASLLTGPKFAALVQERKGCGRSGTPCVPGCTIKCSNVMPDKDGKKIVASLQYESLVLLGPNCGIENIDDIGELNHLCNQVGVDTIECGAAIGVAMDAGVISFGDAEGMKDLIKQISQGTYLGRIIGNGAAFTGQAFGSKRIPVIKGQAIPAYDPRALKGNGVTYITSPMGADHTAGNTFETVRNNDPLGIDQQVDNSRYLQIRAAILDSLGVCLFLRPVFVKCPELLTNLFKAKFGWDLSFAEVKQLGIKVLELERHFNEQAGVSEKYRRIPEFMVEEPLPPNNTVFDIPQEELERIWTIQAREDIF